MKTLRIVVTDRCNLACDYCFYRKLRPSSAFIDLEPIRKMVAYCFRSWLTGGERLSITFSGGEPLVHFEQVCRAVLQIERDYGASHIFLKISTNGTLLTPSRIRFLIKHRFMISLSLDGDRRSHDLHRFHPGGKGSFSAIARALPLLIGYENFNINMVVTPDNVAHLEENVDFFLRRKVRIIRFMMDHGSLNGQGSAVLRDRRALAEFKVKCCRIVDRFSGRGREESGVRFPVFEEAGSERSRCLHHYKNAITLRPDADVHACFACCHGLIRSRRTDGVIGNVLRRDFGKRFRDHIKSVEGADRLKLFGQETLGELSGKYYKACFPFVGDEGGIRRQKAFHGDLRRVLGEISAYYRKKRDEDLLS